jgi:hypothetical protein
MPQLLEFERFVFDYASPRNWQAIGQERLDRGAERDFTYIRSTRAVLNPEHIPKNT